MGLSKTVIFSTFTRYFSEALMVKPTLLYSRLIIQSLAAFRPTLTPKYVKGHFTLNSVLSCRLVQNLLFSLYRMRYFYAFLDTVGPILGINNIFGEGHTIGDMYKPEASKYSKTWNI